mmetsp:Transcript_27451/g.78500  ORF Transcript_27451/g.78500 Transcript_27451/m.78500 type:complete len:220 (+) Transcript_27451:987-1646(+)
MVWSVGAILQANRSKTSFLKMPRRTRFAAIRGRRSSLSPSMVRLVWSVCSSGTLSASTRSGPTPSSARPTSNPETSRRVKSGSLPTAAFCNSSMAPSLWGDRSPSTPRLHMELAMPWGDIWPATRWVRSRSAGRSISCSQGASSRSLAAAQKMVATSRAPISPRSTSRSACLASSRIDIELASFGVIECLMCASLLKEAATISAVNICSFASLSVTHRR